MLVNSAKKRTPLSLFKELDVYRSDKTEYQQTQMRGSLKADTLIIAPCMDEFEYKDSKVPLSNERAQTLHMILKEGGFDTDKDALVVSCSLYGMKANKATTTPIVEFVEQLALLEQFKVIVTVGSDAFKFIIGRGKKPLMTSIALNVMYVASVQNKPVIPLPDIEGLYPDVPENAEKWRVRKIKQWHDETLRKFHLLSEDFAAKRASFL